MRIPKVFAHRGGRVWAPENTLAAFKLALELGAGGIEMDVQQCATGELIVCHDEEISRTTNGVGRIQDCSLDELRRVDAGSWFDKAFAGERLPLLTEVFELIQGRLVLNIELKNAPVAYPGIVEAFVETLGDYPKDKVIVTSFDHKIMMQLNEAAPEIPIGLLAEGIFVDLKGMVTGIGATFLHPRYDSFRPDIAEEARSLGLGINVWDCNTTARWRELVRMEVDGIITDDPQGLQAYLNQIAAAQSAG